MADVYDLPRLRQMADAVESEASELDDEPEHVQRRRGRRPRIMQWVQTLAGVPLFIFAGLRWTALAAHGELDPAPRSPGSISSRRRRCWLDPRSGSSCSSRPSAGWRPRRRSPGCCWPALKPGDYPRGGGVHLRLWLAEQVAHQVDPVGLAGAPWVSYYARALGAKLGSNVDLHSLPPVTGMLEIADGRRDRTRSRPVGLLDRRRHRADRRHPHRRGRDDRHPQHPRTRAPRSGADAEIAPGSAVFGRVRAGQRWAGSPAVRVGGASQPARSRASADAETLAVGVWRVLCGARPAAVPRVRRGRHRCWPSGSAGRTSLADADPGGAGLARPGDARRRSRVRGGGRRARPTARRSAWSRACTRCAAAWPGRHGPPSGCSTRPARSSSRSTRACSPRSGCGCWARRSAATSRRRPSC